MHSVHQDASFELLNHPTNKTRLVLKSLLKLLFKNPAYGRQRSSRCVRLVARVDREYPKNPIFFGNGKKSLKMQKPKNVYRYANISDTPFDQRSLIHWEAWFPGCDGHTDISTHRKNRPIKGRFFEN